VELDFAARALLGGVDDAGVEGTGIDVHADGALVEFARIEYAMDRRERVDGAGVRHVHLDRPGGLDGGFAGGDVLMDDVIIFYEQPADGDGHPAILVFVVVDGTDLADFPADGDEFVESSFVDQVAGVVLAVPSEIGTERIWIDWGILEEFAEFFGLIECGFGELAEFGDELVDGNLFYGCSHGVLRGKV